ncbi:MAG TPA: hypothetical protein VJO12_05600 [Stellaceae bacterium]|nr:hypothetical protein [Stellaceae bacterium]
MATAITQEMMIAAVSRNARAFNGKMAALFRAVRLIRAEVIGAAQLPQSRIAVLLPKGQRGGLLAASTSRRSAA